MIKRTASKTTSSVVNAAQSEALTATSGIKTDAPVIDLQSATNITNFDINSDGTLTLRDPLIYVENPSQALVYRYIFDNTNQLRIVRVPTSTPFMEMSIISSDGTRNPIYLRYTTYTGQVIDELFTKDLVLNWKECEFLDTASSTIITKALVNLTLLSNSYRTDILDTEKASSIFRFLNLFFDTDKNYWVMELISPEVNTVVTDSTSFEANANLDNIYAVRDLYNYGKASVTGILPYMFKNTSQTPSYQLISNTQLDVNPWQGLFNLRLYKSEGATLKYVLSTKVPMSFLDFNKLYNAQLDSDKVQDFLEGVNAAKTLTVQFGATVNHKFNLGFYIPAYTTIASGSVIYTDSITIKLPSTKIYCYPKGTDFETFKDTVASEIILSSDQYSYTIPETVDSKEDIFEKDLNSNGLTLDFYNSEFQLVKHTSNSDYNYILCGSNSINQTPTPDHFIFNKSYGTFKTATVFYVWKYRCDSDKTPTLNSLKMYELTETVKNTHEIHLIDSINNNETRPVILKALITTPTDKSLNYYCNWEESNDGGLTWQSASAFLNKFKNSIHYIPKDVLTKTDETLENADDYITYTEVVPFNPTSEEDLVSERPDVLYVLDFNTSKRYRFNIYYNANPENTDQIDIPNFNIKIANSYTTGGDIEYPKYKNWSIINAIIRQQQAGTGIDVHENITVTLNNILSGSNPAEYSLVFQSSANLRKEIELYTNGSINIIATAISFNINIAEQLYPIFQTSDLSHVERLTYWVTYKGTKIKNSTGNILYYHSNLDTNNYNYYDRNWTTSGAKLVMPMHTNTDPELVCNVTLESATLPTRSNKEMSLDFLERNKPDDVNIDNIKDYTEPEIDTFKYKEFIGQTLYQMDKVTSHYLLYNSSCLGDNSSYAIYRYFDNVGAYGSSPITVNNSYLIITNRELDNIKDLDLPISDDAYDSLRHDTIKLAPFGLVKLKNKVYKDGNTYKKVVFREVTLESDNASLTVDSNTAPEFYTELTNYFKSQGITYTDGLVEIGLEFTRAFTVHLEEVPPSNINSVNNPSYLVCSPFNDITLNYSSKFTLYNNSNRPKIVHYFIEHPNTLIYIDHRNTGDSKDTVSILPRIQSGNVSVKFNNITHTSEVSEIETTSEAAIGKITTDMDYEKFKFITIPAHSSIEGEFTYSCTTKLGFSYWGISIAARMFLALFLQTSEGFAVVTSKGKANAFPWTNYIWKNYSLPCDDDDKYSSRIFSNLEYKNETLNGTGLNLYGFQSLPKFLSKDYKANSAGIRAYVLANQLEYTSLNTNLSQTKFALDNTINLQVGDFTYYDNRIFVYNIPGHVNSIYISNVDSFIMPLNNSLEITFGNTITKLIPWRNYLIAFTKSSIHLISYSEDLGYTAKVINTAVGMPMQDKDSAVTVLNSIIFKSGTKVYKLIPNLYSTSDTILNITCISDSVNSYLEDILPSKEFAFSTYDEYVLCCVVGRSTTVFKYNYTSKIWTKHVYPVDFTDYKLITPDEIYIYKNVCKYIFNKKLDLLLDKEVCDVLPYGDYLNNTLSDLATYITGNPTISQDDISPISFEIEFRQKSSTYQADKQFLESKIILAVESAKPVFPFNIDIASDGMPRVVHIDANTDGPFWQDNLEQTGVLNTLFKSNSSTSESTLKQVFIKYSGKGKTITHKLYGNSNSKFTFYTVNYRYRLLPKKQ